MSCIYRYLWTYFKHVIKRFSQPWHSMFYTLTYSCARHEVNIPSLVWVTQYLCVWVSTCYSWVLNSWVWGCAVAFQLAWLFNLLFNTLNWAFAFSIGQSRVFLLCVVCWLAKHALRIPVTVTLRGWLPEVTLKSHPYCLQSYSAQCREVEV